jgi:hypothetical protein
MRLLADKVPELQRAAYGKELRDVEALIIVRFADALLDDEKTLLERCRQLRNKILHCDFRAARKKLQELGANPQRGDVAMVDIRGLSGQEMAVKIVAAVANAPGSSQYVEDLPKDAGKIFGWLFNASRAGDFNRAVDSFAQGAAVVDRLAITSP